ncbi:hypothetical protein OC835_006172 [Tilletia horrida]|nr:hypothetical protein OC835_006172 [Tilletia horrida]
MPRSALPGELILRIVASAIKPSPTEDETYTTFGRRIRTLSSVSRAFKMAVQLHLRQHFHTFQVDSELLVRARIVPWLPDPRDAYNVHRAWWQSVTKQNLEEINNIERANAALLHTDFSVVRTLSIDLRISRIHADSGPRLFQRFQVPQWVTATTILTSMVASARSLEELHIRIPPQQDMVTMVETIIANNSRLRRLIVEIDSVNQPLSIYKPTMNLTNMCHDKTPYHKLECFIVRAPTASCNVTSTDVLFHRLHAVKLFALSVAALDTPLPNWQWVRKLLQHTTKLERGDVSVAYRNTSDKTTFLREEPVSLPNLTDLTLDLKDVDTRILLNLEAPKLSYLRIHSPVDIDHWPCVPQDHFPSLFSVNMWCPGSSATRMDVLGVPRSKYAHNLNDYHNYSLHHGNEFLAYIKPYSASQTPSRAPLPTLRHGQNDLTVVEIDEDDEGSDFTDLDSTDSDGLSDADVDGDIDSSFEPSQVNVGISDQDADSLQESDDTAFGSIGGSFDRAPDSSNDPSIMSSSDATGDNSSTSDSDVTGGNSSMSDSDESTDTTLVDNTTRGEATACAQMLSPQNDAPAVSESSSGHSACPGIHGEDGSFPPAQLLQPQGTEAEALATIASQLSVLAAAALSTHRPSILRQRREDDVEEGNPSKRMRTV